MIQNPPNGKGYETPVKTRLEELSCTSVRVIKSASPSMRPDSGVRELIPMCHLSGCCQDSRECMKHKSRSPSKSTPKRMDPSLTSSKLGKSSCPGPKDLGCPKCECHDRTNIEHRTNAPAVLACALATTPPVLLSRSRVQEQPVWTKSTCWNPQPLAVPP